MKKNIYLIISILTILFSACDKDIDNPEVIEFYEPDYTALWLVGSSVPAGWDIGNPTPMIVDSKDPFVFIWEGELKPGEFKIPTKVGDWGCDFFMPVENHQDINSNAVELVVGGNPDKKWEITAETTGNYQIRLNTKPPISIHIEKLN
ncbi:hypothetical protein DF185_22115 [Marinifilum breve]|uniref:Uncharacterized protein n=1 Tax=Marinifilum breve TaxID=2184082 RepID=A0A2V3ZRC0_9BACT|nr:SusF/SusE family outer membrane protein [Marinifilum breve]PXX95416.1 hypothetical protein DF185_22115 [Marinifilum breve]